MIEPIRELPSEAFNRATDTRDMLARAARQRAAYNLDDDLIIDIDAHHFETQSWDEIVGCIEDPVIQDIADNFRVDGRLTPGIIQTTAWPNHQNVGGRIPHDPGTEESTDGEDTHRQAVLARRALDSMGIDFQISFPTPMLGSACTPSTTSRWRSRAPTTVGSPSAWCRSTTASGPRSICRSTTRRRASAWSRNSARPRGVIGFTVTSVHYRPVHHNSYMRLYAMLGAYPRNHHGLRRVSQGLGLGGRRAAMPWHR